MTTNHFAYRLIPPRPTFAADMSDAEQAIMGEHAAYWTDLFEHAGVVVFGVVLERAGSLGSRRRRGGDGGGCSRHRLEGSRRSLEPVQR
jgi:hypothetical protein